MKKDIVSFHLTSMKSMMINCFCDMVDQWKAFSLISIQDHCERSFPSRISNTPQAGFEPVQNLSSDLGEWGCALVITMAQLYIWNVKTPLQWKPFKHYFVLFEHKFSLFIQRYAQFWFFRKRFFSNIYLKQERYFSC